MLLFWLARSTSAREMQVRRVKKRVSPKRNLTLLLLLLPVDGVILTKKVSVHFLFHFFLFTKVRFYQKNHSYFLLWILMIKAIFVSPFFSYCISHVNKETLDQCPLTNVSWVSPTSQDSKIS